MLHRVSCLAIVMGTSWWLSGVADAQPADRGEPLDMPRAGAPPVDDGLPPLGTEERDRAALHMMLVVTVSLVAVVLALRWFAKANQAALERAKQEQGMVDRAMDALERFEASEEERKETREQ